MLESKKFISAAIVTASAITNIGSVKAEVVEGSEQWNVNSISGQGNTVAQISDSSFQNSGSELKISQNKSASAIKGQVTSVSQLSDVQPRDWAFQALQSLVERYGCIAGYPNGTFRGDRALTRYEFAAGLNACLDRVNELIARSTLDLANKQDLDSIQRLQEEFSAELATLRGRVDALEVRTAELEKNQFSTTTRLNGEVLLSLRSVFNTDERPENSGAISGLLNSPIEEGGEGPFEGNTTLGYRMRLELNTSFNGKDQLLTRLDASNITRQGVGAFTNMGALQPDDGTGDENNVFYEPFGLLPGDPGTGRTSDGSVRLDTLSYTVPWTDKAKVRIIATGGKLDDFAPTLNALDYGGAGLGSITEFGQRNPIYRLSGAGAGAGLEYYLSDAVSFSVGYLGGSRTSAGNPDNKNGLFNGTYGAIAQLTLSPSKNIDLGLTYVRSYFSSADVFNQRPGLDSGVGSHHSAFPLGGGPMEINSYGVETSLRLSSKFTLGGWAGVSSVRAPNGGTNPRREVISQPGDTATIVNWAVTFAFPDLFKPGSLGGIVIGQPPKTTSTGGSFPATFGSGPTEDYEGESFHIEAFYRYSINSNISITPGVVVITNPEYNSDNPSLILGTVRTTFTF